MKKYILLIIVFFVGNVFAQDLSLPSLQMDIMMSKGQLKQAKLNDISFIPMVYRTDNGLYMLATPQQICLLGVNGIISLSGKENKFINSFALVDDESVFAICDNQLCYLDTLGNLSPYKRLPHKKMNLAVGNEVLYVYDTQRNHENMYSIYAIRNKDDVFIKLIDSPTFITSVLEYKKWILFATKNQILGIDTASKKIFKVYELSSKSEIIESMVYDMRNDIMYFSSMKAIYRIAEKKIECLSDEYGGLLCYDPDGLVVFRPANKLLFRIRNNVLWGGK